MSKFVIEVFVPTAKPGSPSTRTACNRQSFLREFRNYDWNKYVAQVPWSRNGWPGLAIERATDGLRFWVCGYDWGPEFDYHELSKPAQLLSFVVGLTNILPSMKISGISAGKRLTDCDFLVTDPSEVERLVDLFLSDDIEKLVTELLAMEPLNLLSEE